jgi:uncharacterized protein
MRTISNHGIAAFLVIAFGLAWVPFARVLFGGQPVAEVLMPIAPAIACFVVRRWLTAEGFSDAGLRHRFREGWAFYLVAAVWPLLVTPLGVLLALNVGHEPHPGMHLPWGMTPPRPSSLALWVIGSVVVVPIIFGEEFGWRGYLQPRVFPQRPTLAATIVGVLWGVWHYPWLLANAPASSSPLPTLAFVTISTITMSIFLGWLRRRAGSIWTCSLGHSTNNLTEDNLNKVSMTGTTSQAVSSTASLAVVAAEAFVLLGIVMADRARLRWRSTPAHQHHHHVDAADRRN